jgi:hypothetical protein
MPQSFALGNPTPVFGLSFRCSGHLSYRKLVAGDYEPNETRKKNSGRLRSRARRPAQHL